MRHSVYAIYLPILSSCDLMAELDITPDWILTWQDTGQIIDYLPQDCADAESVGGLRLVYTNRFLSSASSDLLSSFEHRLREVLPFFPEITGEVKIGITSSYKGLAITESHGGIVSKKLSFPPLNKKGLPSKYVIGHELMHLSQAQSQNFPRTERATDIFTLARLPPELLDSPPVYLRIPDHIRKNWLKSGTHEFVSSLAHELALQSVILYGTYHKYILRWESTFEKRIREMTDLGLARI